MAKTKFGKGEPYPYNKPIKDMDASQKRAVRKASVDKMLRGSNASKLSVAKNALKIAKKVPGPWKNVVNGIELINRAVNMSGILRNTGRTKQPKPKTKTFNKKALDNYAKKNLNFAYKVKDEAYKQQSIINKIKNNKRIPKKTVQKIDRKVWSTRDRINKVKGEGTFKTPRSTAINKGKRQPGQKYHDPSGTSKEPKYRSEAWFKKRGIK
jgi:hypothetical protein